MFLDQAHRGAVFMEEEELLTAVRRTLSLFCPSGAAVNDGCAVWGQQLHLQHSLGDCGTVPTGGMTYLKSQKLLKLHKVLCF